VSPVLPTGKVDLKFNFIETGMLKGTGELYINGKNVADQSEGGSQHAASNVHRLKQHSIALRPLRASGGAPTWTEGIALNCKNRAAANQVLSVMIVSLAP
jgi:hypothetical protein